MNVVAETAGGVYTVDVETERVTDFVAGAGLEPPPAPRVELPLLVTAAAEGSTVAAVVRRRPPLVISHDAGLTWKEAGSGLPAGSALAIAEGNPDRIAFASASRIYVSSDGGRFWRGLEPELDGILRVAWLD